MIDFYERIETKLNETIEIKLVKRSITQPSSNLFNFSSPPVFDLERNVTIFYDTSSGQFPSYVILNIETLPLTRAKIPKLLGNPTMYRNQFAYRSRFSELNQTKHDDIFVFAKNNSLFKIRNPVYQINDMINNMHPDNYSFVV
jgi:hypothetical protein